LFGSFLFLFSLKNHTKTAKMPVMHLVSHSAQDTQAIAARFAEDIRAASPGKSATVIALYGDLGAGKTTFVQGFARALGIAQQPKSPTFMLMKQYPIPGTTRTLWHLDCYRLAGHQDLRALDMHRVLEDSSAVILIEWPERIGEALPRDHIEIHFEHLPENDSRRITLPAHK
jgi:tRNA threonylcarbamoyladenosine biosynthesis protein TsaE